jgi:3-dehydroquinate synthase
MMNIYLYGPSGSGKSTIGPLLANALGLAWFDLDKEIEIRNGASIEALFETRGEAGFRELESEALRQIIAQPCAAVVALGGGALLDSKNRQAAEKSGSVLFLSADTETLLDRLDAGPNHRPLLKENPRQQLGELLAHRKDHYASFGEALNTSKLSSASVAWDAQVRLGAFSIAGMEQAYDVRIQPGNLDHLGHTLQERSLHGPVALVCDQNVASLYATRATNSLADAGYAVELITLPVGEQFKTIETVGELWGGFLRANIDRGSTVVALGGGVTGDLAGFAAATFLRGVPWVNVPTTLLAMVDSSLGGKTGADLPQGKNLIGAFYAPRLVLADPLVLQTLPSRELRNGLAEALKHGIVGDAHLYELISCGWPESLDAITHLVSSAAAVKVKVIEEDPYEHGPRQALNLGHTVGHGVELASGFAVSHGEAVAIGTVIETRLAEQLGFAHVGLAKEIAAVLTQLGLPTTPPSEIKRDAIITAMQLDKKRSHGQIHFALPEKIGRVRVGITVNDWESKIEFD